MNSETAIVRARVEPQLKDEAESVLARLGLTMSEAIRMYLSQITMRRGIPFDVEIPNEETLAAMREAEAGGLESTDGVDGLFAKLRK